MTLDPAVTRRPTLLTDQKLRQIVGLIEGGSSINAAALSCGLSKRTIYYMMNRGREALTSLGDDGSLEDLDEDFERRYALLVLGVEQAKAKVEVQMGQLLVEKAVGGQLIEKRTVTFGSGPNKRTEVTEKYDPGDWRSAQYWLRTQGGGRWSEKTALEVNATQNATGGNTMTPDDVEPDEARALRWSATVGEIIEGSVLASRVDDQEVQE